MQGRLGNAQKGSQGTFVTTTAAPSAGAVKVNGWAQDGSGKQHIIAQGAPGLCRPAEKCIRGLPLVLRGLYTRPIPQ